MDLQGPNPKIRGLALRSLCGLKFDGVTDYMRQGIEIGLNDFDPYVKKTAVLSCVKLYHLDKENFG